MKNEPKNEMDDDLRPEYAPEVFKNAVRGKYAARYAGGTNLALLAPDVAEAFPDDESVNEALRLLLKIAKGSVAKRSRSRHQPA
jgi:hypothetical protein